MDTPNRNAEKGWSLWDLVRGGWAVKEGPSSPTPDSNPPIRPGQGTCVSRLISQYNTFSVNHENRLQIFSFCFIRINATIGLCTTCSRLRKELFIHGNSPYSVLE